MDPRHSRWAIATFLICLVAVLYALFRPEPPEQYFYQSDKWGHVLAFAALGITARLAFLGSPAVLIWLPLLCFAPLSEWFQHQWRPARFYSLDDALANIAGVLLAMAVLLVWRYRSRVLIRFEANNR